METIVFIEDNPMTQDSNSYPESPTEEIRQVFKDYKIINENETKGDISVINESEIRKS